MSWQKERKKNEKENRTDIVPILVRSVKSLGRTGLKSCLGNRDCVTCLAGLGKSLLSSGQWVRVRAQDQMLWQNAEDLLLGVQLLVWLTSYSFLVQGQ